MTYLVEEGAQRGESGVDPHRVGGRHLRPLRVRRREPDARASSSSSTAVEFAAPVTAGRVRMIEPEESRKVAPELFDRVRARAQRRGLAPVGVVGRASGRRPRCVQDTASTWSTSSTVASRATWSTASTAPGATASATRRSRCATSSPRPRTPRPRSGSTSAASTSPSGSTALDRPAGHRAAVAAARHAPDAHDVARATGSGSRPVDVPALLGARRYRDGRAAGPRGARRDAARRRRRRPVPCSRAGPTARRARAPTTPPDLVLDVARAGLDLARRRSTPRRWPGPARSRSRPPGALADRRPHVRRRPGAVRASPGSRRAEPVNSGEPVGCRHPRGCVGSAADSSRPRSSSGSSASRVADPAAVRRHERRRSRSQRARTRSHPVSLFGDSLAHQARPAFVAALRPARPCDSDRVDPSRAPRSATTATRSSATCCGAPRGARARVLRQLVHPVHARPRRAALRDRLTRRGGTATSTTSALVADGRGDHGDRGRLGDRPAGATTRRTPTTTRACSRPRVARVRGQSMPTSASSTPGACARRPTTARSRARCRAGRRRGAFCVDGRIPVPAPATACTSTATASSTCIGGCVGYSAGGRRYGDALAAAASLATTEALTRLSSSRCPRP